MSVHWLSEEMVRFEIEVGFTRNLQKCNSHFTQKPCFNIRQSRWRCRGTARRATNTKYRTWKRWQ